MEDRYPKERHKSVKFWLCIIIILNLCVAIFYAVKTFEAYKTEISLGYGLCSILGVINILGAILLLRWRKPGFYILLASTILCIFVNLFLLKALYVPGIISFVTFVSLWLSLSAETGEYEISTWSQLESGWDYNRNRHIYQLFSIICIALFILTIIAIGKERKTATSGYIVTTSPENRINEKDSNLKILSDTSTVYTYPGSATPTEHNDSDKIKKDLKHLEKVIADCNRGFPKTVAEGIVARTSYLEGDYVYCLYEVDENIYDLDVIKADKKEIKKNLLNIYKTPIFSVVTRQCVKVHKGLGVKFKGMTTGNTVIIKIPYSELEDI